MCVRVGEGGKEGKSNKRSHFYAVILAVCCHTRYHRSHIIIETGSSLASSLISSVLHWSVFR